MPFLNHYQEFWRTSCFYLALVALLVFLLGEAVTEHAREQLEFNRELIRAGEWWRIFSGNLVHYGRYHTVMNGAGFAALVAILFWPGKPWHLPLGLAVIPVGVGLGLLWTSDVEIYRGFSGANYGLLAFGLLLGLPDNRFLYSSALLVVLGKIIMEQMPGYDVDYLRDRIGVAVGVDAHLAGFCTGVLLGGLTLVRAKSRGASPAL